MIKLTEAQKRTLQTLTNRIELYYGRNLRTPSDDEHMHYRIAPCSSEYRETKAIIFQASNTGSPWFCSHKCATIIIGERGGINKKLANLDNMRPGLVF